MPNTALVPHVIELLKTLYVFPETEDEISELLAAALAVGRYDGADPERLGQRGLRAHRFRSQISRRPRSVR